MSIHITKDGESICILGACLGNNAPEAAPWTPIIEKIDKVLAEWNDSNLT